MTASKVILEFAPPSAALSWFMVLYHALLKFIVRVSTRAKVLQIVMRDENCFSYLVRGYR